jgi:hypothetical protein
MVKLENNEFVCESFEAISLSKNFQLVKTDTDSYFTETVH